MADVATRPARGDGCFVPWALSEAERTALHCEELLGIVSHDLRTPLVAVGMHLRELERLGPVIPASGRAAVHAIRDSVGWMQRLIQDLLDVAGLEHGRLHLLRLPVDPVVLVAHAMELLEPLAREAGIALECDVPDDLPVVVVDGDRVLQVLSNLGTNAIKFTPHGGTVTIRADASADDVHLAVVDTGSGIAPEELPHVFERFWRSDNASHVRGTGLGLTIARGLVEEHGGRIWIESVAGRGTTVHFTLPR
jgi:signal transduction histidine kinase